MIIGKTFTFDAAHYLPNYEGKCKNMHGHTWRVTLEVKGELLTEGPNIKMVMDLNDLKTVAHLLLDKWDHRVLNIFFEQPTCEEVAKELFSRLQEYLPAGVTVHSVQVQEGEGGWARCEN